MNIHGLFATPVGFGRVENGIKSEELDFIFSQERGVNNGNEISKDSSVLDNPCLSRIRASVDGAINDFVQSVYAPTSDPEVFITQSWVNYTKAGQYHHKHNHPNSFLSGVLYIKTYEDRIQFFMDGYQQIKVQTKDFNVYNSDSWWFDVNQGDIVVFPSGLSHMVPTVEQLGHERVSIAFNTFVKYVGDKEQMTKLHLEVDNLDS